MTINKQVVIVKQILLVSSILTILIWCMEDMLILGLRILFS